jgi:hypothetical protein
MPSFETGYVPFDADILQRLTGGAVTAASSQAAEGHSGIITEGSIG